MNLYNFFRSSASYRVRIACNLKGLQYTYLPIHLRRNGGEQFAEAYHSMNPQELVPLLDEGEFKLSQSLAILEYLEEKHPEHPLLPGTQRDRATIRKLSLYIACDIHPLNNLRVLEFLGGPLNLSAEQKQMWIEHWLKTGLEALEQELSAASHRGRFCFGDTPTMADCCLIPQIYSARRFNVDMSAYPVLGEIESHCLALEQIRAAAPERQPDSES
jgi:maleylpyruvate isomerase